MDKEERFAAYAAAFELSYVDNDWERLAQYFTEDASYDPGDGSGVATGRDAVLQKFQDSVSGLDRLMNHRDVQLHDIATLGDTVVAQWTARYTNPGLPLLEVKGTEFARFRGNAMAELRDEISEESLAGFGAWMAENGSALR